MSKSSEASDNFLKGYACSQAVISIFADNISIDELTALKISSAFAGGMRKGETCGVVTAALMTLGLKYSPDSCTTLEERKPVYKLAEEFYSQFLKRHKSLICQELLGVNPCTPEGNAEAVSKNLHGTLCPVFVKDAVEILEEMLSSKA